MSKPLIDADIMQKFLDSDPLMQHIARDQAKGQQAQHNIAAKNPELLNATKSFTLYHIAVMKTPIETPSHNMLCVDCNYARWLSTPTILKCYCKEFHEHVWTNFNQTLIVLCDSHVPKEIQ